MAKSYVFVRRYVNSNGEQSGAKTSNINCVARRERHAFTSTPITQTKLAFISILVPLIRLMHTQLLCQWDSLSIARSCVDDRCAWVAVPGFRGMRHILTNWSILGIIEAVRLMPSHCSSSTSPVVSLIYQRAARLAWGKHSSPATLTGDCPVCVQLNSFSADCSEVKVNFIC